MGSISRSDWSNAHGSTWRGWQLVNQRYRRSPDWNRSLVDRLQAAHLSEPEPPPPWPAHLQTEDEINAWIYESNQGRSVREVLDESHQVFQQLFAFVEGLPDDVSIEQLHEGERVFHLVWLGDQRFPAGEFFYHFHDDHEPDMRA